MLEDLSPTVGILNNLKRGRIITLLQEIQREIMVQGYWSQIEVLVCSLSARAELKSLYMKVEALLNVSIFKMSDGFVTEYNYRYHRRLYGLTL